MPETSNQQGKTPLETLLMNEPDKARRMFLLAFQMEFLRSPEDALTSFNTPDGALLKYEQARIKAIADVIAERTGADPEQIINPETRTEEQQRLIWEITGRDMQRRIRDYLDSNFVAALTIIKEHAETLEDNIYAVIWEDTPEDAEADPVLDIPHLTALYFFALHTDIDPRSKGNFDSPENREELIQIFDRMDAFYRANRDYLSSAASFAAAFIAAEKPANAEDILKVVTRKVDSLDYPLDKPNDVIWGLLGEIPKNGQYAFHMERRGSKAPVLTLFSIDFSKIEEQIEASGGKITRKLSQYDKRVYVAAASIYNSGQNVFSFTRLYEAMGNTGRPGAPDFAKLEASIKKLEGAIITLDNKAEIEAGYKYPKFKYYGSLMPLEFVKAEIDGVPVDAAIHLFREPPLISFARQRKQFTTIALKMLQAPVSKTENALAIEDYLLEYIARTKDERKSSAETLTKLQGIKAENRTEKDNQRIEKLKKELDKPIRILTATIFEKAGITDRRVKKRATETTIPTLLTHYKNNGFIRAFTSDKNGFTIIA